MLFGSTFRVEILLVISIPSYVDLLGSLTLAKKPGLGKVKAGIIHIDHFLDDLVKDDSDSDPSGLYDNDDPVNDIYSSNSENNTISSENKLETNILAHSWSKPQSSKLSKSESTNLKSNSEENKINTTEKNNFF
ncbi:hypothetical protein F8M41_007245 [Gigaspora margarita]|uniref:Uncharacterized protein n=1 Tax=Gigaspora margarita TaxID=4874 RepID=A0A8H3X7W9_GIGMA|nr:hypothetical protein F8M41_007245 [Gigaspora margarita]